MIGEIRDLETAQIAVQSALTGHLVLSTVHTNDAPSTVNRLLDMGVEDYLLTSTVVGIQAQRLVRTLCQDCKEPYTALPEIVEQMGLARFASTPEITLWHPKGCPNCAQTGYIGRISIIEIMLMTDTLRSLIMRHATSSELRAQAIKEGMLTMYEDGLRQGGPRRDHVRGSPPRDARELGRRPMPVFRYRAVDAAGDVATGELEAANEAEIVDRLRDQGLMPMQVARAAAGGAGAAVAGGRARAPRLVRAEERHARPADGDDARARDAAEGRACRSTARSRS